MVQRVGGKDVICVAYLLSLHSLKQLVVSKCLVPCSSFQAILGERYHAVLLEDVVTGLFLSGHQTQHKSLLVTSADGLAWIAAADWLDP